MSCFQFQSNTNPVCRFPFLFLFQLFSFFYDWLNLFLLKGARALQVPYFFLCLVPEGWRGGGGGTAIYGLYSYVPLSRVWFSNSLL